SLQFAFSVSWEGRPRTSMPDFLFSRLAMPGFVFRTHGQPQASNRFRKDFGRVENSLRRTAIDLVGSDYRPISACLAERGQAFQASCGWADKRHRIQQALRHCRLNALLVAALCRRHGGLRLSLETCPRHLAVVKGKRPVKGQPAARYAHRALQI